MNAHVTGRALMDPSVDIEADTKCVEESSPSSYINPSASSSHCFDRTESHDPNIGVIVG